MSERLFKVAGHGIDHKISTISPFFQRLLRITEMSYDLIGKVNH